MSDNGGLKSKFARAARANLNELLDRIREIDDAGGLRQAVEDAFSSDVGGPGFEQIGGPQGSTRVDAPKNASDKTLRDYYANLEVPYGSDFETVKASYRRLMRKYHPDKFAHDGSMEGLSTQLTQELTRAYQAIESYLKTGKY